MLSPDTYTRNVRGVVGGGDGGVVGAGPASGAVPGGVPVAVGQPATAAPLVLPVDSAGAHPTATRHHKTGVRMSFERAT